MGYSVRTRNIRYILTLLKEKLLLTYLLSYLLRYTEWVHFNKTLGLPDFDKVLELELYNYDEGANKNEFKNPKYTKDIEELHRALVVEFQKDLRVTR